MATSLYGTVKKIGSSQFTFDKIYTSRLEMENALKSANGDGIYHGRYVLVSYGNEQNTNQTNGGTIRVIDNDENIDNSYSTSYNATWVNNYNLDINEYQNVYDKTVWQKIFDGTTQKYIMVASLNARAPGLTINEDYYSFELENNENGKTYYVKTENNNEITTKKATPHYSSPKWNETLSNELIYHLDMPMPLRINLNYPLNYTQDGFNPGYHYNLNRNDNFNDENNYIRWEHILEQGSDSRVLGADFNLNIPAIGQVMSDIYDAMYGIPVDSNNNPLEEGNRPSTTGDIANVLEQTGYIGIIGVLSQLGLIDGEPPTHMLKCDWAASEGSFGSIMNKPKKIMNITAADDNGLWTFTVVNN